jgi:hypothetical protein
VWEVQQMQQVQGGKVSGGGGCWGERHMGRLAQTPKMNAWRYALIGDMMMVPGTMLYTELPARWFAQPSMIVK